MLWVMLPLHCPKGKWVQAPGCCPCGSVLVLGLDKLSGTRKLHQGLHNPAGWGCPGQQRWPELLCDSQTPWGRAASCSSCEWTFLRAWWGKPGCTGGSCCQSCLSGTLPAPPGPAAGAQGWQGLHNAAAGVCVCFCMITSVCLHGHGMLTAPCTRVCLPSRGSPAQQVPGRG